MSYVFFAWVSIVVYAFEAIIIKLNSKYSIKNPWLFNFLWNIFFVLFLIPVFMTHPITMPERWTSLLIVSALSAASSVLFMISSYRLDVSVLSPLYNVRAGLSVFFAWLLLGETMTQYQMILVGIILIMGFLVTIDEKTTIKSFFRKDILIAMVFMVILSLYVVYLKITMNDIGFWNTLIWSAFISLIFIFPTYPLFKKDIKHVTKQQFIPVVLVALTSTAGFIASNKAYEGNVGISSAIMTFPSSMILAFILALIWPKLMERHSMKIYAMRFAATAVMFVCALQLT